MSNCSARSRAFGSGGSSQRKFAISSTPLAFNVRYDFGKIEPLYFGQFLWRALEMFLLRPEPQTLTRRSATGATGALFGGRAADFFDEQCVDAAARIEARDARQSAVDH